MEVEEVEEVLVEEQLQLQQLRVIISSISLALRLVTCPGLCATRLVLVVLLVFLVVFALQSHCLVWLQLQSHLLAALRTT